MSLKKQLYNFLKSHPNKWVHKQDLSHFAESLGFMGENGTRRMRELVNENPERIEVKLESTKEHGKTAFYRYVPSKYEVFHAKMQSDNYQLI